MLGDLNSRERHAAIKALLLAMAAMESVPERRRPMIDRESVAALLTRLDASAQETELYTRAADWVLREIAVAATTDAAFPPQISPTRSIGASG